MTDQSKIVAAEARFPLARLYVSELNPRQSVGDDEIKELAISIWEAGMIQPMAGLADAEGGAGIVGGGRRLRALQYLREQHSDLDTIRPDLATPLVTLAPDMETARVWAGAENAARRDLSPADEIVAYGKMAKAGSSVVAIARAFAVTEQQVRQRLALADLPDAVIDALRAEKISISGAAAFTVSQDEALTLQVLETVSGSNHSAATIKRMLQPESVGLNDRRVRFVGIEQYEAAGGKVTRDLFSQDVFLTDVSLLDELFASAVEARKAAFLSDGWKWCEVSDNQYLNWSATEKYTRLSPVPGDFTDEESERHDELAELCETVGLADEQADELSDLECKIEGGYTEAQKAVSGVFACIDFSGQVQVIEALVAKEDAAAAIEAGVMRAPRDGSATGSGEGADTNLSPYSAKLAMDLRAIALGARQHAAVNEPDLLLDLLAYQLAGGFGFGSAFYLRPGEPTNTPETQTGYALDERLTKEGETPTDRWTVDIDGFHAFRKRGRKHRNAELTRHLARLMEVSGGELGELIDTEAKTDIRAVWTPTAENFLSRMKADWLEALWNDLLDLAADHPKATAFAKKKKGEKAQALETLFADPIAAGATEAQAAKIAAWVPDFFE